MVTEPGETPSALERRLLGLLLRGQTPAQAAETVGLDVEGVREMLADLSRRSGVSGLRPLLIRALIHGWLIQ